VKTKVTAYRIQFSVLRSTSRDNLTTMVVLGFVCSSPSLGHAFRAFGGFKSRKPLHPCVLFLWVS